MAVRVGVLGLGSVYGAYAAGLERLVKDGRVEVTAVFDIDQSKIGTGTKDFPSAVSVPSPDALIARPDVDAVLVLTSMNHHAPLAMEALSAGKHVLVEKPMATSLEQGAALLELSRHRDLVVVCAPHVFLSPTYQEMHKRVRSGVIGDVKLARGLYGWPGPTWAKWFYQVGGGALFDLGVYNITSLCGFLGRVRRVTSLMGAAVPERTINGELIKVEVADVAQVLLDFGNSRFASITTGFTIQKYGRGPGLELYGLDGTMNLLGDDWAPDGFEQWRNEAQQWEIVPEVSPGWQWTSGLTHLVECIEGSISSLTLPEHAFHVLEVMLASERSAQSGNAVDVSSDFPDLDFSNRVPAANNGRAAHDTRITR